MIIPEPNYAIVSAVFSNGSRVLSGINYYPSWSMEGSISVTNALNSRIPVPINCCLEYATLNIFISGTAGTAEPTKVWITLSGVDTAFSGTQVWSGANFNPAQLVMTGSLHINAGNTLGLHYLPTWATPASRINTLLTLALRPTE